MKNWKIKLSLFLNYFVFAILLNSVGAVILQVQRNFDVTKSDASILEGFKDLPIAICSFLLASFLPKIGYKKAMLIALALVSFISFSVPYANGFWHFKLLFLVVGVSFALIKISVFATIGLITKDIKEHSSFMGLLEGTFMVGVLLGNILFSLFIDNNNPKSPTWLSVYWIIGGLSVIAFLLLLTAKLDESAAKIEGSSLINDFWAMLRLIILPLVIIFIVSIFLFVLIEQSFQTWTPTFYKDILKVSASMGIQAGAVLAGAFAIGRFASGIALRRFHWIWVVSICLIICASLVLLTLPLTNGIVTSVDTNWTNAPLVAYLFPIMGIFLAPIYPTINSVILSSLPKHLHSPMSGLIVVFSALGGTTGSIITGHVFDAFTGQTAFYLSLIPMGILLICLQIMNKIQKKSNATIEFNSSGGH
jgi:fucose permease